MSIQIHKAICYGPHEGRIVKELGAFSQQLTHHTPEISCGLFDFNWTLFYSVWCDMVSINRRCKIEFSFVDCRNVCHLFGYPVAVRFRKHGS